MRGLKLTIGLLAVAVFAGGCIMEPLDPESEEEDLGSVTEGVSAAPSPATQNGTTNTPMIDGVLSNKSASGSGATDPEKPQPDPWTGGIRRTEGSSTTPTTTPAP